MADALNSVDRVYHQPIWGRTDPALRHCLLGAAAAGAVLLAAILVAPARPPRPLTFEQVPDRIARLILEKPKVASPVRSEGARLPKVAPVVKADAARPAAVAAAPASEVAETAAPRPATRRSGVPAPLSPEQGVRGREQARTEVAANLKQVAGSLDDALGDLTLALPRADATTGPAAGRGSGGRSRQVRAARTGDQVGGVAGRTQLAAVDLGSSGLGGGGVSIVSVTDLESGGGTGGGVGSGSGGGGRGAGDGSGGGSNGVASRPGSEGRSNASLLAVVRRYAPGIQFCYENELKRNPTLRGKLVFSLTVDAAGRVTEAMIVEDGLGAAAVSACALAQVREWVFPAAQGGLTTFRTPFVFTPPQ